MNSKTIENIFKYQLKKDARTVSVATLLSSRYLKRIIYNPYYQRNYVWEKDKKSFFIESIFLGTEIPPIVFFKKGTQIEVIDGRQRFETLKRFREDNFGPLEKVCGYRSTIKILFCPFIKLNNG